MKKIIRAFVLLTGMSVFAVTSSRAQEIVVGVRPHRPAVVVARPARPSPRHVWVAEEWTPSGGTYAYRAGYWAVPPRNGGAWVPGHWRHRPRGYVWVPGHWR